MLQVKTIKGTKVLAGATDRCELQWVTITGEGRDNYNEDGKVYQATGVFDKKPGEELIAQIQEYYDSVKDDSKQQGGMGHRIGVLTKEGDTEVEKFIGVNDVTKKHKLSGRYSFTFSTNAEFKGKATVVPLYNAKRNRIQLPKDVAIGNGSEGHLQVTIKRGTRGKVQFLSLYLNGVQLKKFVKYEGVNDFEADEDEEGFEGFDEGFDEGDTEIDEAAEPNEPNDADDADDFDDDIPF